MVFIQLESRQVNHLAVFLKKKGIFCQVHYLPVYLHPYYQSLGYKKGLCSKAEDFYQREISLPLYFSLTKKEMIYVIKSIKSFLAK